MVFFKNVILVFLLFGFSFIAQAKPIVWKTLHTPRFKILVAKEYIKQGHHIAEQSEKALDQLLKIYSEYPKNKILIVVDHRTNASNGSATHFPYPHIIIYPTLPTTYSSIGEYNEWVYELVLHELAHFLTFYPNHGIYKPIQLIFGNLFAPNFILLPSWFHEGLAVNMETHLTHGGRMRSENYKEMYKVLVNDLKDGSENLARINERYLPSFPYGQRPYFFGSLVVNETTKDKKPKDFDQMIQGFSRAIPPYNIRSGVKKNFGKSFIKSRKEISLLNPENPNPIETKAFQFSGHSAIWLDNNSFITLAPTKDLTEKVILYSLVKNKKLKTLITLLGPERVNLSLNKTLLLYDQLAPFEKIYNTTDLFIFNLKTKKITRLTYGAKLREAAFSSDTKKIVAVQTDLINTSLVELNYDNPKNEQLIYKPIDIETRISAPNYFDQDKKIIFLEKPKGLPTKVKVYNLSDQSIQSLDFSNSFEKIFWIESQNGKLLLHAKEKSKPRQHYVLDENYRPTQITFDEIGTRSAALNKDQILVSHLTKTDYKTAWFKNFKSKSKTNLEDIEIKLSKNFIFESTPKSKTLIDEKKYSFLNYMIPKYWFPFITPNYGGFSSQYAYSMSTGSSDPFGINSYSANLRQDTISQRLSGGINFFHVNKDLIWGLYANQFESPLTESISRTYQTFALSSRYDFGHSRVVGSSVTLSLKHTDANLEDLQRIKSFGPQVSYEYNSLRQEPSRVAPSKGIFTNIAVSHYLDQKQYFSYNFIEGYIESYFSKHIIPSQTSFKLFSKFLASDERLPTVFTPVNLSGYFTASRQQNSFVIRGYPSGIFQASESAYNVGAEYYFPILNIFNGPESLPFFFSRIYGSIVADAGSFKGRIYDSVTNAFINHNYDQTYAGVGLELHGEVTMGHYIPLKLSLGIYNAVKAIDGIQSNQVFINLTTPALP
jgi:hypothetical protein